MKNDAARRDLSIGTKISPKDLNAKKLQSLLGRSSDGQNIFFENLERTNLCEKRKTKMHLPCISVVRTSGWHPNLNFGGHLFFLTLIDLTLLDSIVVRRLVGVREWLFRRRCSKTYTRADAMAFRLARSPRQCCAT